MPLYIAKSGDLEGCHACLTDSQRKDRATQLLIKYKSGALVTQIMFGHQSPVPRNNTASYQFPLRKLYNLRSLSWWNLFFWASFLNMDVCDHWIWSLVQIDANFIGKEITFCGLYLLSISPNGTSPQIYTVLNLRMNLFKGTHPCTSSWEPRR